jgi:hypothetical protein
MQRMSLITSSDAPMPDMTGAAEPKEQGELGLIDVLSVPGLCAAVYSWLGRRCRRSLRQASKTLRALVGFR